MPGCVYLAYLRRFYKDLSVNITNYPKALVNLQTVNPTSPITLSEGIPLYVKCVNIFPMLLVPLGAPTLAPFLFLQDLEARDNRALYFKGGFTECGYKSPQARK